MSLNKGEQFIYDWQHGRHGNTSGNFTGLKVKGEL